MTNLSILIPTYNTVCVKLVAELQRQAAEAAVIYEIIVADDGSTDTATVEANKAINTLPHSIYIIRCKNEGRSRIRNFLARQAKHDCLLFIDSDMVVRSSDYIHRYVQAAGTNDIVYGGYIINANPKEMSGNLRYRYEMAHRSNGSAAVRRQHPYADFHTSNFLVRRELFLRFPLDERFRRYGYEDVLWGKTIREQGVGIQHIDNALSFEIFEDNTTFIEKTEESLRTLHEFSSELRGYSSLLTMTDNISRLHLNRLFALLYPRLSAIIKRQLRGNNPRLLLFNIYKVLYYCHIDDEDS